MHKEDYTKRITSLRARVNRVFGWVDTLIQCADYVMPSARELPREEYARVKEEVKFFLKFELDNVGERLTPEQQVSFLDARIEKIFAWVATLIECAEDIISTAPEQCRREYNKVKQEVKMHLQFEDLKAAVERTPRGY